MADAAAQSKTPVSSGLANDDGVLLNHEGGKMVDNATAISLGGSQNEDNNRIQAQVVDESPEPPIAEFWGKYGEDVDEDDDNDKENEPSDFIENVVGKKVDGKGINFDDILEGGETGEGFNGSGIVGIEAPAVEKVFDPLNVELSGKDIEEECRPSDGNGGPDFTKDGLGKKVYDEDGISNHDNLSINKDGEDYAGKVPFSDSDPTKLLHELRSIAKGTPVASRLELTGIKSCLSAFFRHNGGKDLAFYQEVVGLEGFEDQTENFSGQSMMQRCVGLSESYLSGTRKIKKRSVAKLMKEGNSVEPSNKKVKRFGKQISSSKNAGDEDGSVLEEAARDMTGSRKRKKSKYMCYPYTNLENLDAEIFTPKRGDYVEEESEKITKSASVGERMKRAAAKLLGTSPIMKKKDGHTSAALSGTQSLADMLTSAQEVLDHDKSVALDPNLGSDTCDMLINSISAYENAVYKEGSSKSSSVEISLGVDEEQKEKTLAEILREKKKEFKRAKKANNEGLVYIKEKLKKMTEMVDNCNGGDMPSEWKASLEKEAKELLEKIGAMAAKPPSS